MCLWIMRNIMFFQQDSSKDAKDDETTCAWSNVFANSAKYMFFQQETSKGAIELETTCAW